MRLGRGRGPPSPPARLRSATVEAAVSSCPSPERRHLLLPVYGAPPSPPARLRSAAIEAVVSSCPSLERRCLAAAEPLPRRLSPRARQDLSIISFVQASLAEHGCLIQKVKLCYVMLLGVHLRLHYLQRRRTAGAEKKIAGEVLLLLSIAGKLQA